MVDWWYKTGCLQHVFGSHEKSRDVERERESGNILSDQPELSLG